MASLIIIIKTPELINIDLNSGLYLFGISTVNSNIINENSYQYSNRFDELTPGVYNWAVKHIQTGQIKARGTDVVKRLFDGGCYSKLVNNVQEINITFEEHKKDVVCDIECFIEVNNNMFKFIPDTARVNLDGSVTIIASTPFTGKVTIC
jgi:hypothetical protein